MEKTPSPGTMLRDITRVPLTRLDKVLFPEAGITKRDVLMYYIRLAPRLLPFLHNRPLTLHRFPDGIGGQEFFEKDAPLGTPGWVDTFTWHLGTADRDVRYILCNNLDTLIWIANLASLEIHAVLATAGSYQSPDLLLFDIDPEPPRTFEDVMVAARAVRGYLVDRGLDPYIKTSGKKACIL